MFNCSPDFDVLIRPIGFQDMLPGDAHRAQAVEDGLVKSSDGSEFRKDLNTVLFSML